MSVRSVRLFEDPVLRTFAQEVVDFDRQLRKLVRDLSDTMIDEDALGLAAPQIGVSLRAFAFDVDDVFGHIVNPTLHFPDDEELDGNEGCVSFPGLYIDTVRRRNVVAHGFNVHGDPISVVGNDLLARCIQHEVDHLDGVLFIDRLDEEARRQALEFLNEQAQIDEPAPFVKFSPHRLLGRFR